MRTMQITKLIAIVGILNQWPFQTLVAGDLTVDGRLTVTQNAESAGTAGVGNFNVRGYSFSLANGPHATFKITGPDDYPLFQIFNWSRDNIGLNFDSYYDGGWKSSDSGSNFQIYKNGDNLLFRYDSGNSQGSTVSWLEGFKLEKDGDVVFSEDVFIGKNGGTRQPSGILRRQFEYVSKDILG